VAAERAGHHHGEGECEPHQAQLSCRQLLPSPSAETASGVDGWPVVDSLKNQK
jgi:hypothetical protein